MGVACGMLIAFLPTAASASHITLDIRSTSFLRAGRCGVDVHVTNRGDEPAQSVWVEASLADAQGKSETVDSLAPDDGHRTSIDLGPPPQPYGTYTVVLTAHYADGNGYPFTALRTIPLVTADPTDQPSTVTAVLRSTAVKKTGRTRLNVSNMDDRAQVVTVTLAFPHELMPPQRQVSFTVPPHGGTDAEVVIRNLTGLPGSTYAVYAIANWVSDGLHHSTSASSVVRIEAPWQLPPWSRHLVLLLVIPLLAFFTYVQFWPTATGAGQCHRFTWILPTAVLLAIVAFLISHLAPSCLIRDTLTVGGDTPAHAYLASHLKAQLFSHGRLVSWGGGWWCGFPMFQFYFCLPYVLTAILDFVLPFNVAFKLVSILGICLLPLAAYASARLLRLPKPGPLLAAIATIPYLFDASHTMWGVNLYSTLAGMISNSLSFPIMLLFIGSSWRDADDGQIRARTMLLLVALLASHFFTSVMAVFILAGLPLMRPRAGARKALLVLIVEGLIGCLIMAWWLLPLFAKHGYTAPFGTNWEVNVWEALPRFSIAWAVLAASAVTLALFRRVHYVAVMVWMLCVAAVLFCFGYAASTVFVNVRLWPFMTYALFALAAAGLGLMLSRRRLHALAVAAVLLLALVYAPEKPKEIRGWARWNYEGLEAKPTASVFKNLVMPLAGTPGRLANDLNPDNNWLGSTRVFECVPHLTGKPILEGGLVNSAAGSIFSYYIQGETSKNCAGFPTIVKPASFNFTNATAHLELFNVKHFIARWPRTQQALDDSPSWERRGEEMGWQLYEMVSHDGSYVFVPPHQPIAVRTDHWKETGLEWIYSIGLIDQPFILLPEEDTSRPVDTVITEEEFLEIARAMRGGSVSPVEGKPLDRQPIRITEESITDNRIRFRTNAPGLPHIVKCTFYPNWKVRGADRVYMVTPCFMLVYPEQEEVELYYGHTFSDTLGKVLSALGLLGLVAAVRGRLPLSGAQRSAA